MKKINELLKKKSTRYILFGIPVLVGGYFIYKELSGRQRYKKDVEAKGNIQEPETTPPVAPEKKTFGKYVVSTLGSNLNVRETASTSASIVGSLPNGEVINANPSATPNWYEYSKDGSTITGYVSGSYIKKA